MVLSSFRFEGIRKCAEHVMQNSSTEIGFRRPQIKSKSCVEFRVLCHLEFIFNFSLAPLVVLEVAWFFGPFGLQCFSTPRLSALRPFGSNVYRHQRNLIVKYSLPSKA